MHKTIEEKCEVTTEYAQQIFRLAENTILLKYRMFSAALQKIEIRFDEAAKGYVFDGQILRMSPDTVLKDFLKEQNFAVRLLLHCMFHGLFRHFYKRKITYPELWHYAIDIAVENVVLQLDLAADLHRDSEARLLLSKLKKRIEPLTADHIYREFASFGLSDEAKEKYKSIFSMDTPLSLENGQKKEEIFLSDEEWRKIAQKVKTELTQFDRKKKVPEILLTHLHDSVQKKQDYKEILQSFATLGEEITVNPDEFDYVYYAYGLSLYQNMPLVEPLEYAEVHRVRDFALILDTSASCSGDAVRTFVKKTFSLLKMTECFSSKVNLHILQCDASVREDTKITSHAELDDFLKAYKVKGFGATDYRPAFSYIDELLQKNELTDFKGVIYFTDGYGVFPQKPPVYDVMFVLLPSSKDVEVPPWAIKVLLEEDELEDTANEY